MSNRQNPVTSPKRLEKLSTEDDPLHQSVEGLLNVDMSQNALIESSLAPSQMLASMPKMHILLPNLSDAEALMYVQEQ